MLALAALLVLHAGSQLPVPHEALQPIVIEGRALEVGGQPASGAVVLSSLGGSAATNTEGAFRLAIDVPRETREMTVTVVHGSGVQATSASRALTVPGNGTTLEVGTLQLAEAAACAPAWLPTFGPRPGFYYRGEALAVYDDGAGPALYVGGYLQDAGGVIVDGIARWDGTHWSSPGGGVSGDVQALQVFDDGLGAGPALYVGGDFKLAGGNLVNNIARWDGNSWSSLGTGTSQTLGFDKDVWTMTVFDDGTGSGPALYVGGSFDRAGPDPIHTVTKWDGVGWAAVGSGIDGTAYSLCAYDDGSGDSLYIGGLLLDEISSALEYVYELDGADWIPVGGGTDDIVRALTVFDDGSGPALFAGGEFVTAGGVAAAHVAKWQGSNWSALGTGVDGEVRGLGSFDSGGGPELYVGGEFLVAGGVAANALARWNGSTWAAVGEGFYHNGITADVRAFVVHDEGNGAGPELFCGGSFQASGELSMLNVGRWDGSDLNPLGTGLSTTPNPPGTPIASTVVLALTEYDDGSGPALYFGGEFDAANSVLMHNVGRWDGAAWSALGEGVNDRVHAMVAFDDGNGPALYVAGEFTVAGSTPANRIARWDGSTWEPLGAGANMTVRALATYETPSGPILVAGGDFATIGGVAAAHVAGWNGHSWLPLGSGTNDSVRALRETQLPGRGNVLAVGGYFTQAGGVEARRVATWDGSTWAPVGGGIGASTPDSDSVSALATYADGSGNPKLYAAGNIRVFDGTWTDQIARWDGANWLGVAGGLSKNSSSDLLVHDDGAGGGRQLYVGGSFVTAGGMPAKGLARWNGSAWSNVGTPETPFGVLALAEFTAAPGQRPSLVAGGSFSSSPAKDSHLAVWGSCDEVTTYCTAGTSAKGCQAQISSSGVPSASAASGFLVDVSGVDAAHNGLFFFGANGRQANPWGNGSSYQCVVPPVTRTSLRKTTGAPGTCSGAALEDFNATWTASPPKNPGSGAVVQAQFWFRDPLNTSNQRTSLSDALEFVVAP